jgi:hypothetical protein
MPYIASHAVPVRAPTDAEAAQALLVVLVNPEDLPGGASAWGDITGTLSGQADLQAALDAKKAIAGIDELWLGAGCMTPRTTNGAAAATVELATNDVMLDVLDFDATTEEGAGFVFSLPQAWNEGTVKAKVYWTSDDTGAGGVAWGLRAGARSDDDVLDAAFGTEQVVADTVTAAGDLMISAATSALTIGGTPAAGDLLVWEITREVANGSDTSTADARLIGVKLQLTNDTVNAAW